MGFELAEIEKDLEVIMSNSMKMLIQCVAVWGGGKANSRLLGIKQ